MGKLKTLFATAAASATSLALLSLGAMAATFAINAETSSETEYITTMSYGNLNGFSDTFKNLNGSDFKISGAAKTASAKLTAKQSTNANARYILVQVQNGSLGSKMAYGEKTGTWQQDLNYDGTIKKSYYVGTTFIGNFAGPIVSDYQITAIPKI